MEEPGESERVPGQLRAAVVVIAAQSLALVVTTVILLVKIATGDPHSVTAALFLAACVALGAAILALCARSMLRMRPAARTPVVVIELIALPVSFDLTFQAHRVDYGAPILVSALVALYLLFTPTSRAALDREL